MVADYWILILHLDILDDNVHFSDITNLSCIEVGVFEGAGFQNVQYWTVLSGKEYH